MVEPSVELQEAIYATLTGDPTLTGLIDGVYDAVPANAFGVNNGYISFGLEDQTPDDADCISADEHTFQIDVWSRQVGRAHCKQVCHRVKRLLHGADLNLAVHAFESAELVLSKLLLDPDGLTAHGILQFTFSIEDRSA